MNPSTEEIIARAVASNDADITDGMEPIIWTIHNWHDALQDWFPELPSTAFTQNQHIQMMVAANRDLRERHPAEYAKVLAERDAELERKESEETKPTAKKRGPYKRAVRVSRSPETWRILPNYPDYQISNHGRLRSLMRAKPEDCLKPRFSWWHGKAVAAYKLLDKDGRQRSRFVGGLMMSVGFLKPQTWMAKGQAETVQGH